MKKRRTVITKTILAWILILAIGVTSNLSTYANGLLDTPVYQSTWGLNFPQQLGNVKSYGEFDDVVAIDYTVTDTAVDNSGEYMLAFAIDLLTAYGLKIDFNNMREIYDKEIKAFLDNQGNVLPVKNGSPQLTGSYLNTLKPGSTLITVLFKKDSSIGRNFTMESESYWEKVKSSVVQPNLTGKISHTFSSGVSETQAYNLAKTVGSSVGMSIGAQLKGGGGSGGTLMGSFTYSVSKSITESFSRSTTIVSQESTAVEYTFQNTKDHPVGIAIYRPVEVFRTKKVNADEEATQMFNNLINAGKRFNILEVKFSNSFEYNYSDYVSLISE